MADPFSTVINNLFPTALLVGRAPNADALNARLREVVLAQKAKHPGVQRSNVLGWHSTTDMLAWAGDAGQELGRICCGFVEPHTHDAGSPDVRRFGWMAEMWANVSPPNASNQAHAHPGALWSIVYYVDDGFDGPDPAQGGELVLQDPRFPMTRMYAPDMYFKNADGEVERNNHTVRPESGMIVAFPSWLNHSVRPYRGNRDRISIAVNLMIAPLPRNA